MSAAGDLFHPPHPPYRFSLTCCCFPPLSCFVMLFVFLLLFSSTHFPPLEGAAEVSRHSGFNLASICKEMESSAEPAPGLLPHLSLLFRPSLPPFVFFSSVKLSDCPPPPPSTSFSLARCLLGRSVLEEIQRVAETKQRVPDFLPFPRRLPVLPCSRI